MEAFAAFAKFAKFASPFLLWPNGARGDPVPSTLRPPYRP